MTRSKKAKRKKFEGAHIVLHRLLDVNLSENCKGEPDHDRVQAILLFKRGQTAPVHARLWSLVGGKPKKKPKETPEEAAIREMKEELKICDESKYPKKGTLKNLAEVGIVRQDGKQWIKYFSFQLDLEMDRLRLRRSAPEEKELRKHFPYGLVESEGLSWFTAEEIHQLPMRPEDRIAINKFFEKNGI